MTRSVALLELGNQTHNTNTSATAVGFLRQWLSEDLYESAVVKSEQETLKDALEVLDRVDYSSSQASFDIDARLAKACHKIMSLNAANRFHARLLEAGLEQHIFLANQLVGIYDRCGSIQDARTVFNRLLERNLISWNTMIAACNNHGYRKEALQIFDEMKRTEVSPNRITFIRVLTALTSQESLFEANLLHARIVNSGLETDLFVGNALINVYRKCGSLKDAERIFWQMPTRDVVSWTAMIAAYAQLADTKKTLKMFQHMKEEGVKPNKVTFLGLLNACTSPAALAEGKQIHSLIRDSGMELDIVVGNSLISMYGKCGSLEDSHNVFLKLREPNVVSWNAIIAGYAQQGCGKEALELFKQMHLTVTPNKATFVSTVDACASQRARAEGRLIHAQTLYSSIKCDVVLQTALLNMYGKCGCCEDAQRIFDRMAERNVVSWTAMISAYAQHGCARRALQLFQQMSLESMRPNNATFVTILNACTSSAILAEGKMIHAALSGSGVESEIVVGNTLINMYGKCGKVEDAFKTFGRLPKHDVVSWTTMIAAYAQHGHDREALKLFNKMRQHGVKPNSITFMTILDSCASRSALAEGKLVHECIIDIGLEVDFAVGTALVNMYGRCGSLVEAYRIFSGIPGKDVISWNVMLAAYAQHGYGKRALHLFQRMLEEGVQPDDITFISVITACSHAGLIDVGHRYFESMKKTYSIKPTVEHYVCMVDLLGRAGLLERAENFINCMPFQPTAMVWMSYLGACRIHGNLERGAHAAVNIRKLEPQNPGAYVVLSNIYAAVGRWDEAAKVTKEMVERGVTKELGRSSIEVKQKVHEFILGDRSHPQTREIYDELAFLLEQIKEAGYLPDTNLVLHDVDEEQKDHLLAHHSEKLAISFGLISTPRGTPLHIFKNLRMCSDCHNAIKYISKAVERDIVVKDASRFHHFKNGWCTCGDFW